MVQFYGLQVLLSSSLQLVVVIIDVNGIGFVPVVSIYDVAAIIFELRTTAGWFRRLWGRIVSGKWLGLLSPHRFNVLIDILGLFRLLFKIFVIWFWQQVDIVFIFWFVLWRVNIRLSVDFPILLLRIDSAIVDRLVYIHLLFPIFDSLVLLDGQLSPPLLILMLLVLPHVQRLMVPPRQFLLGSQLIPDCLIDSCATAGSLDVGGVEVSHVGLIHRYPVLARVLFRTRQHSSFLDLGVVELTLVVLATRVSEVLLTRGYFGGILFGLAIVPGAIWEVALTVEGIGFVVGELIVVHNKIM